MMNLLKSDAIDPRWAWSPYQSSDKNPWDLKKAGHLYRRAAFGASWPELEQAVAQGAEKTLDLILKGGANEETFYRQLSQMAKHARGDASPKAEMARGWWLHAMLLSPNPLQEKLTLFWHGHFATSNIKVKSAAYMVEQNQLLRRHALGSFRTMLQEISKDPAMMIWLDTNLSKKGKPNENYARELMELFSLGITDYRGVPNYTEEDVREAARAFTGWDIKDGKFIFNAKEHDEGKKTVHGQTGNWNGEDIVRICLEQKVASYFITRKLFRFFVSETIPPTDELLEPLATQFRQSDYQIAPVVATILRSNLFFSPQAYRSRVKSPTDFAVGIVKALEGRIGAVGLATALDGLGQRIFYPPSVKGWDAGTTWLDSTTLLMRQNLALAMTAAQDLRFGSRLEDSLTSPDDAANKPPREPRFGRRMDPALLVRKYNKRTDEEIVAFFIDLFFQGDVASDSRGRLLDYMAKARSQKYPVYWTPQDADDHRIRAACHLALSLPEIQLD